MTRRDRRPALAVLLVAACGLAAARCSWGGAATPAPASQWNSAAYAGENTIELGVVRPDGSPHWFKVWVVVVDGQAYVRLGARSVAKIEANRTAPHLGVRVAGYEFEHVKGEPAPEMVEKVAAAMADKYWSDVLVRYVDHPLTLRLHPD